MTHLRSATRLTLAALCVLSVSLPAQAQVDPGKFLDTFESTFGKYDGYRRSGAKGVCATGEFVGSAEGRALSSSAVFSGQPVPVVVRFSVGGANPNAAENTKTQRNMALQFAVPGGEVWQMGNISSPVFGAATPEQFFGRIQSLQPDPATKAADPAKVKAFADANPDVLLQGKYFASQPVPASFAAVNYWGVHGFAFVDRSGKKTWGKWVFEPVGGTAGLTDDEAKAKGATFLAADLRDRVQKGNVTFNFNLQIAESGDKIDSAVVPLPAERKKVTLGQLRIKDVAPDAGGSCLTITFIPTQLPKGVEPSADPMLAARAAPYAVGLGRRLGEGAKQ
jgi:catalase